MSRQERHPVIGLSAWRSAVNWLLWHFAKVAKLLCNMALQQRCTHLTHKLKLRGSAQQHHQLELSEILCAAAMCLASEI